LNKKKLCELQSPNIRDYAANFYPLKSHFLEGHISAPTGCCAPKFLQALEENDQFLVAHSPTGDGGPSYKIFQKGVKNCLKM